MIHLFISASDKNTRTQPHRKKYPLAYFRFLPRKPNVSRSRNLGFRKGTLHFCLGKHSKRQAVSCLSPKRLSDYFKTVNTLATESVYFFFPTITRQGAVAVYIHFPFCFSSNTLAGKSVRMLTPFVSNCVPLPKKA